MDLINIPFDEKIEELLNLWCESVKCHFPGKDIYIPQLAVKDGLETLEWKHKKLDLFFSFARTIHYDKDDFLKK